MKNFEAKNENTFSEQMKIMMCRAAQKCVRKCGHSNKNQCVHAIRKKFHDSYRLIAIHDDII